MYVERPAKTIMAQHTTVAIADSKLVDPGQYSRLNTRQISKLHDDICFVTFEIESGLVKKRSKIWNPMF